MALEFNLRHLERGDLELKGELTAEELELEKIDDLVKIGSPVQYDLLLENFGDNVLVQGRLQWVFACECVRCLKPFEQKVDLKSWVCDLPLEGEEKVSVNNDLVDLTPFVREDILLGFPQHPLCEPGCPGMLDAARHLSKSAVSEEQASETSSAWAELNKLKF